MTLPEPLPPPAARRSTASMASRLGWRLGGLFVVAFLVAGLLPYINSRDDRTEVTAETLQADMRSLAQSIARETDGRIAVGLPPDLHFAYRVRDGAGTVLAASPDWEGLQKAVPPDSGPELEVSVLSGRFDTPSGPLLLDVMLNHHAPTLLDGIVNEWGDEILPLLLPVLAAALLIGVWTIRRSLAPLARVADAAASITPRETGVRLPGDDLPSELVPLVTAVNDALDRLAEGFRHQREFAADAAHELRTPLAVLSAHIETLPDKAAVASLKQDLAGMRRLVDQMLAVAELDAQPLHVGDELDLSALAVELATAMAPLCLAQHRDLSVIGAEKPVRAHGDAAALRRALRNLVENAIAHTPEHAAVEIQVSDATPGRGPSLTVRDAGPGFAPADRARVTQRFYRGRRAKGPGAGLGLAIVARIMAVHGGELEIGEVRGGGAAVSLRLPPLP
ncbi:histidine kinase [Hypericibacter terrae]|uniref:histidine kinase n=1 Tax=Hypericibacter terrae TaxID=2602015 RepID=A0A5J6MQG7_9PROT|nr:HAMP domain-containing sensor histidine kinase [Hypericibacter terrae]QEX19589.1 histidine kinase [Hypericibacter terrae]